MLREIDALDGVVGRIVDKAGVQFRVLNRKKGPAVWGPRAQIDRALYKKYMREEIEGYQGLSVVEGKVADIIVDRNAEEGSGAYGKITGVRLESGQIIPAGNVVITTGTFLGGEIHIGLDAYPSGRMGEAATFGLSKSLRDAGKCSALAVAPEEVTISGDRTLVRYVIGSSFGKGEEKKTSWFRVASFVQGAQKEFLMNVPKG